MAQTRRMGKATRKATASQSAEVFALPVLVPCAQFGVSEVIKLPALTKLSKAICLRPAKERICSASMSSILDLLAEQEVRRFNADEAVIKEGERTGFRS
jgi:hypothetical protein